MESGETERPAEGPPPPPPTAWPPPPVWPPPATGWPPPPSGWPPPPPAGAPVPGWNAGPPAFAIQTPAVGFGRFRPLGVGELIDASFTLYRRNLLLLVAIAAVVQVPFAILNLVIFELLGVGSDLDTLGGRGGLFGTTSPGATLSPAQATALKSLFVYTGIVVAVQVFVVLPLSLAAMSRAVSDRYLDRPVSLGASYAAALRRGGSLLGAILLLLLIVAGVSVAAIVGVAGAALAGPFGIVPAIAVTLAWIASLPLLAVRSTLFAQAIVVEGVGSLEGLRRSWRLTRGFFWRTLGILAVVLILQSVVGWVLQAPVALLVSGAGTQQLVGQGVSAITSVVVAPLSLIALTLVYYDYRIRREAFDIEMLAASL